jgi:hypothetical protein
MRNVPGWFVRGLGAVALVCVACATGTNATSSGEEGGAAGDAGSAGGGDAGSGNAGSGNAGSGNAGQGGAVAGSGGGAAGSPAGGKGGAAQGGAAGDGAGGDGPFGGAGGGTPIGGGGAGGAGDGCAVETKLIYLLGKGNEFYSFDPPSLALTKVGTLDCPQMGGSATPFSMSVDRSGTAWVLYNDGQLYQVNTKTAVCKATSFVPSQGGFKKFGMGFVSDAPGSTAETLFVANTDGIGKLDTKSLTVTPIGQFGFAAAAELAGTGDARLFGFFFGFPPYITEIDKTTSMTQSEAPLDSIDAGTGFAFAFWGADFWVFTAPNSSSSQIDRYQPDTKTTTTVNPSVGFKIVGAGVSTCAPTVRPDPK